MLEQFFQFWRRWHWLSCKPFIQGHFWCHHCIPWPWKCVFWYTTCHTFHILKELYYVLLCWWRPFWIFACRKFCPRVAEFGDLELQTTCKKLSYDVKNQLVPNFFQVHQLCPRSHCCMLSKNCTVFQTLSVQCGQRCRWTRQVYFYRYMSKLLRKHSGHFPPHGERGVYYGPLLYIT